MYGERKNRRWMLCQAQRSRTEREKMDWMIEYCRTEAEDALKRGCRTEAENERASLSWNEAADRLEKFKEGIGEEVPQTKRCHSLILQLLSASGIPLS
jgi:hypothetical protein